MAAKVDPARQNDARRRAAIIDIGSNSVRLVIYEGPPRVPAVIFNEKVAAGLGRGVAIDGHIRPEDMARAMTALRRFTLLAKTLRVTELQAVATAAVRDAVNGADLIAAAAADGLAVRLLSGEEEGEAAGLGVLSAIPDASGVAVDLGGGSLELAVIDGGAVHRTASFPLGVQRLPPLLRDGDRVFENHIAAMLKAADWPTALPSRRLYLVGGSWRAVSRLDMHLTQLALPIMDHHEMPRSALRRLRRATARMTLDELRAVPGMSAVRAALLPDAVALLAALAKLLDTTDMVVSSSGLREGLLFSALPPAVRAQDPLLVAAEYEGRRLARFSAHGEALDAWLDPIFADDAPAARRLRLAACLLADVAWSANPDFRAERAAEVALHGNWRAADVVDRYIMAKTLHSALGGGAGMPAIPASVAPEAVARAHQWGLAIRLAQRLSGGMAEPLQCSALRIDGGRLVLELAHDWDHLHGEPPLRLLRALASAMGLDAIMETAAKPAAPPAPRRLLGALGRVRQTQ